MARFKFLYLTVAAVAFSACGAQADVPMEREIQKTVSTQTAPVSAWTILSDSSHLKFTAKQEGVEFTGEFPVFEADIKFDPDNLEGSSVNVTVPLKQVDAGTGDRNSTLPGQAWFATKKFPEAVYTSNEISKTEEGLYIAKGVLKLKGTEKPLDLPFKLKIEGQTAEMKSQLSLDRTSWNVGEDPWNTDEWVSKVVTLDISVTAEKT